MILSVTKQNGKPHTIRYTRDNGTETWMHASDYFVRHDLSHFVLESVLGYTTAFNGMINQGMDIHAFENRGMRLSLNISAEAWYAENMANLFFMETVQGETPDFNALQQSAFKEMETGLPVITLTDEAIAAVRAELRVQLKAWEQLPEGETLSLIFPL
jgi:hypothetical protein